MKLFCYLHNSFVLNHFQKNHVNPWLDWNIAGVEVLKELHKTVFNGKAKNYKSVRNMIQVGWISTFAMCNTDPPHGLIVMLMI